MRHYHFKWHLNGIQFYASSNECAIAREKEEEEEEQIKWNVLEISQKAPYNSTLVPVLYEIVKIEENTSF